LSLGPTVDAERRFPSLDVRAVLFEDDDLIAIDKPAFVPSQSGRGSDDLPSRVRTWLLARDGVDVTLGVHQRLDAMTSGVVVYAKRPEANLALAQAFEQRTVGKRYVAVVAGSGSPPVGRLTDRLRHDRGVTRVDGSGDVAACTVSVLEKHRGRALVAIELETGRTHQIRVQLAARGWSVVGDPLYGGSPAARLMLHAEQLTLPGRPAIHAPLPAALERALKGEAEDPLADVALLRERLFAARERRYALGHDPNTTAFRLLHTEADGVPGLALDVYGDYLVAHFYRDDIDEPSVLAVLGELGFRGIYVKRRPAQANELGDEGARALAPSEPVSGQSAPNEGTILELGVPYPVRLGDGLSTGLFLDQRDMRARIAERASGGHLLNLFSYTCGFSVAAARAGAKTTSVDASKAALDRGRATLAALSLDASSHRLLHDDAFEVLARMARRGERFEVIVCDPPTYSRSKKTRFTSSRAEWIDLLGRCLMVLAPGGLLYATSNDQRIDQDSFRRMAHEAATRAQIEIKQAKDGPVQVDFPSRFDGARHLKSVLITREG
jgi:23S rRNA (cytosine1962-C5)-methyltransferase